jgi:hypothetical protein
MGIKIKYGRDMTTEEFNKLLALDIKFFGNNILTNEGMALKRFLKFKDCIISMYSGDTPMGFVCFFNVDYSIYQRALTGQELFDDNLCENEVMPMTKERENYILLFDLIVDDPYRNQGISKLLFGLMGDYLKQKCKEGYEIGSIFGYTMSSKGHRHSSFYGGRDIWTREDITFVEMEKEVFIGTL